MRLAHRECWLAWRGLGKSVARASWHDNLRADSHTISTYQEDEWWAFQIFKDTLDPLFVRTLFTA